MIIDTGTEEGFRIVEDAREYLLSKGRKSLAASETTTKKDAEDSPTVSSDVPGSYVVAPVQVLVRPNMIDLISRRFYSARMMDGAR